MSSAPTVYVGIVTYNSINDLPACIASLQRQTCRDLHIVVLDNASQDQSANWIREHFPDCELIINDENVGFGRAHNRIIRHCRLSNSDFYMPLNPDVTLDADYVERVVDALMQTGAGWASGKLLEKDNENRLTGRIYSAGQGIRRDGFVINIGEGMRDEPQFDKSREVFLVSGAAPIIRGELIASIAEDGDLFDRAMFMYAEDIDMGWRARLQGWRCWYVAEAVAYHRGGVVRGNMRTQALGNLMLSTIKNAYPLDLFFCNVPLFFVSWLVRLLTGPQTGILLVRQLLGGAPTAWRKRRSPKLARGEMHQWFAWSERQLTEQPSGVRARLHAYLKQR